MQIKTRQATADDITAILVVDQIVSYDEGRKQSIRRSTADRNCYVAEKDEEIVGYGILNYHFFNCGFIEFVYVHPMFRHQGIGEALVACMETVCRTPKLFTSTNLSNLPMQSLLAKRGYVLSGVIHNLDPADPELIYLKSPVKT